MDVVTYLSKYFDEEDSLFIYHLSRKPMKQAVPYIEGKTLIEVDEDNNICHLPLYFHQHTHNDIMFSLQGLKIAFKSIDMLPLYKIPKQLEDAVVVCPKTNRKFYF